MSRLCLGRCGLSPAKRHAPWHCTSCHYKFINMQNTSTQTCCHVLRIAVLSKGATSSQTGSTTLPCGICTQQHVLCQRCGAGHSRQLLRRAGNLRHSPATKKCGHPFWPCSHACPAPPSACKRAACRIPCARQPQPLIPTAGLPARCSSRCTPPAPTRCAPQVHASECAVASPRCGCCPSRRDPRPRHEQRVAVRPGRTLAHADARDRHPVA